MPRSTSATAAGRRCPTANWSGLVFSLIQNAQNIGYLIPVEEIQLFLKDVADGSVYDGKPQIT